MEWMILPLKRYADFSGRSRRKEYWMFFLFQCLVQFCLLMILLAAFYWVGTSDFEAEDEATPALIVAMVLIGLWALFWLAMFIPNMAVVVRRLHDQDIPGIVGILLYIGTVILTLPGLAILIFMCLEGKKGDNQYGEDPKMNENVGEVFR